MTAAAAPNAGRDTERGWSLARNGLLIAWVAAAAANMARWRAGFLTSHAADLTLPAWLHVVARDQAVRGKPGLLAFAGRTPWRAAGLLFLASATTEASQRFWPRGPFAGTFDPLDMVAYAAGLAAVALSERRWPRDGRSD